MEDKMKRLLCLILGLLLLLSMVGCKQGKGGEGPATTDAPMVSAKPDLADFGPWVLTAEYEPNADHFRQYRYAENGALQGFGDYKVTSESNDLGGRTLILTAYDADGNVSSKLSKLHYLYNADGKLAGYQRYEALGGKLADSFVFEYDTAGNVVKQEKFYMDNWHETITYTYEGTKLVSAGFKSSVHEASYGYGYDDSGVISRIEYSVKYVKSGNVVKGTLVLQKSIYEDDTTYRVSLSSGGASEGVTQGKEVLRYEVKYGEQSKPLSVTLEVMEWGVFQSGFLPMRQMGALNPVNLSGGSAKFVYQPLGDYVVQS